MRELALVSVIMTVYNGEKYLPAAIDSIVKQTFKDFEFVIVDDGSQDQTSVILKNACRDPRVKVLTQSRIGRASALNLAWQNTTGKYIANFDSDDLTEADRLERQLDFLEQHSEIGLLGTAWKVFGEQDGKPFAKLVHPPTLNENLRRELVRRNPFNHSSVMIPRKVMKEIGGYNNHLSVAIDYDLWVRIARDYQIANLPQVLVSQRSYQSFFNRISLPKRYKTISSIRWRAWCMFSHSYIELPYVFNPLDELFSFLVGMRISITSGILRNKQEIKP
jgi:glycosyltransferase involved in cell wall biosynthesis